MPDTAEAVIEAIRTAFVGVPRGAITIHEAEVIDVYGSDAEREAARVTDTEPCWDCVPDADIEVCTDALCYLDPEGWRYYIPAYMIWSLRHFRVSCSTVPDRTIYTFDPSSPDLLEHNLARYELLDEAQSRAVCRFLRYMVNENFADVVVAKVALDE